MSCRGEGATHFEGCECREALLRDALAVCRMLRSARGINLNMGEVQALVDEAASLARNVLSRPGVPNRRARAVPARAGASLRACPACGRPMAKGKYLAGEALVCSSECSAAHRARERAASLKGEGGR